MSKGLVLTRFMMNASKVMTDAEFREFIYKAYEYSAEDKEPVFENKNGEMLFHIVKPYIDKSNNLYNSKSEGEFVGVISNKQKPNKKSEGNFVGIISNKPKPNKKKDLEDLIKSITLVEDNNIIKLQKEIEDDEVHNKRKVQRTSNW